MLSSQAVPGVSFLGRGTTARPPAHQREGDQYDWHRLLGSMAVERYAVTAMYDERWLPLCMLRPAGAVRPVSRVTRPIRRRLREGEGQGKGKGLLAKKG